MLALPPPQSHLIASSGLSKPHEGHFIDGYSLFEACIFFPDNKSNIPIIEFSLIIDFGYKVEFDYFAPSESVAKTPLFFEKKWNEKRGVIYLGYHS